MAEKTTNYMNQRRPLDRATVIVVVLLAVAALWRLVFFLEMYASPYANDLGLDGKVFNHIALEVAAGRWTDGVTFFQAPLYPRVLGLVYLFFGPNPIAAKLVQIILSVLSCWLVYRIAEGVFDRMVARIALAMSSVYGMFLYFANELVVETFFVFVTLIALDRVLWAWHSDRFLRWWIAGLAFGIAAITRGTILPFVVAIPLWLLATRWRDASLPRLLLQVSVFTAGVVLMVLPVTVHNYWADQNLVLVASNDGVNFYIGNNPDSDGMTAAVVNTRGDHMGGKDDQIIIARSALGDPEASPGEVSSWWYRQGFRFIIESPADWLRLTFRKMRILANAYEVGNNRVIGFMARHSIVFEKATISFWLVMPLAVAGLLLGRGRRPQVLLLFLFLVTYSVLLVAFFVTARYRLPMVPVLIIFAAAAVVEWWRWLAAKGWTKGRRSVLRIGVSVAAALLAAVAARPVESIRNNDAQAFFGEAEAYRSQGVYPAAAHWYALALAEYPQFCDAGFNLGRIHYEVFGDPRSTVATLESLVGPCGEDVGLRRLLGRALCGIERCEEGVGHLRFVAERSPDSPEARADLDLAIQAIESK